MTVAFCITADICAGCTERKPIKNQVALQVAWDCFDFASTATNITTTLAVSVALLALADCDTGDRAFPTATAKAAAGRPLASAFRTQKPVWHRWPALCLRGDQCAFIR
jgi:hypothetical protein